MIKAILAFTVAAVALLLGAVAVNAMRYSTPAESPLRVKAEEFWGGLAPSARQDACMAFYTDPSLLYAEIRGAGAGPVFADVVMDVVADNC